MDNFFDVIVDEIFQRNFLNVSDQNDVEDLMKNLFNLLFTVVFERLNVIGKAVPVAP